MRALFQIVICTLCHFFCVKQTRVNQVHYANQIHIKYALNILKTILLKYLTVTGSEVSAAVTLKGAVLLGCDAVQIL